MGVMTHPCPNINDGVAYTPLKDMDEQIYHTERYGMWLFIHALVSDKVS